MEFFKINGIDFSQLANSLLVTKNYNYNVQQNAHGDTVADFLAAKRIITVGIIPLSAEKLLPLLNEVDKFSVTLSFLDPHKNAIEEAVPCIITTDGVEAYTLQQGNKQYKGLVLSFQEL